MVGDKKVKKMNEEKLYKYIEKFLIKELNCFETKQKSGVRGLGIADVIGLRDIGGKFSTDIEVISVEVKTDTNNFGKICGQALGYSVLAHKCYLAIYFKGRGGFTQEQKEIANRLGIGLIEIRSKKCREILSSSYHTPINALMNSFLINLNYGRCSICGQISAERFSRNLSKAFKEGKDFRIKTYPKNSDGKKISLLFTSQEEPSRINWVCKNCIKSLSLGKK